MSLSNHFVSPRGSVNDAFRALALKFSEQARECHTTVSPFVESTLPYFSRCSPQRQESILSNLNRNVEINDSYLAMSVAQRQTDPNALLWRALQKLGLRPPGSLFNHISCEDIVEIHLFDGTQIFRNFTFFEYCSYSLEELYCCSWIDLYHHSSDALEKLLALDRKIFQGQITEGVPLDFKNHTIEELKSPLKFVIDAKMKYLAPLFGSDSKVAASVVIEAAELVNSLPCEDIALKRFYGGSRSGKGISVVRDT